MKSKIDWTLVTFTCIFFAACIALGCYYGSRIGKAEKLLKERQRQWEEVWEGMKIEEQQKEQEYEETFSHFSSDTSECSCFCPEDDRHSSTEK